MQPVARAMQGGRRRRPALLFGMAQDPTTRARFARYVALGDSLSIDLYPARSAHPVGTAAEPDALPRGLGAAALLHANDDARWPEFAGRDLRALHPGIAFRNMHVLDHAPTKPTDHWATDGATTVGVLAYQLHRVPASDEPTLVTVTAGRADVLQMTGAPKPPPALVDGIAARLERLVRTVREKLPHATLLVTTAPDPSDGTGALDADTPFAREAGWIAEYNERLRALAAETPHAVLADAAAHFAGRGNAAHPEDRWFWPARPAELNARGASELRRVWLEALGA
jgi:lysophospholipase L1-like esterase